MTLPTRTLKEIARIAAFDAEVQWLKRPPRIDDKLGIKIADAVAIAVLREVEKIGDHDADVTARKLLAEFDAPAQETTCWRCQLPYLDGRVCSGSNFTLMCAVKDAPGAQDHGDQEMAFPLRAGTVPPQEHATAPSASAAQGSSSHSRPSLTEET